MGDEEKIPVREWEVVSMTDSTYAAAPNSNALVRDATRLKKDEIIDYGTGNSSGNDSAETSHYVFGGDLVFPPSQHENLPLESEDFSENENDDANEEGDYDIDEGMRSGLEHQNQINIKGYHFPIFDAKGNLLSVGETIELEKHDAMLKPSSQCESSRSVPVESSVIAEVTESYNEGSDSSLAHYPKHIEKDDDACNLPCGAWWNRKVASLYVQIKETNGFCSICVAAAILGFLILGQHWQQERWQLLQMKWQSSIFDERIGKMMGPLTRLKDMIIGGQRRGSLISSSDS